MQTETTCERAARLEPAADLIPPSRSSARPSSATAIGPPAGGPARRRWHPGLRYLQIIPVALVLWGLDDAVRFNTTASISGMRNAPVVGRISGELGGGFVRPWNDWLLHHSIFGTAASWYYVLLQGALTGLVGVWLIWRRAPHFAFHRDALIACNVIGLLAFWFYPVAPPRMLPGYHDITGINVPIFSSFIEGKAADQFASLPSLHVVWALWVAVAMTGTLRTPVLKALVWLYPVATILDVLATANHYWLDVITAPVVLALAYGLAAGPEYIRRHGMRRPGWLHLAVRPRARAR